MRETDLYPPVKLFLESQGYEVKGEVVDCDVVGVRADTEPVVVELKRTLNLPLVLQAVERLSMTPNVYVGVPRTCALLRKRRRSVGKLLRRLGLGLLVIEVAERRGQEPSVEVLFDPGPYRPRMSPRRRRRLLGEFQKRVGDPNRGGAARRGGIVTAYRQRAARIASYLRVHGPTKASVVARDLDDAQARNVLYRDVYGWFDRPARGIYALSPRGERESPEVAEKTAKDSGLRDDP